MKYSIKDLLLVTLLIVLVLPYVLLMLPEKSIPFTNFSIDDHDLKEWLSEINSATSVYPHCSTSHRERTYEILTKSTTSVEVMTHIKRKLEQRIRCDGWEITESESLQDSFFVAFGKGITKHRIYFWRMPQLDHEASDKNLTKIKQFQISYSLKNRLLRADD